MKNATTNKALPLLYGELASWWPLLSAPSEYAEEAEVYRRILCEACAAPPRRVFELGSGGGNNAFHLKAHWQMTLVDRSPAMLAVSRALNPECEHIEGDLRSVRLGRVFDAVFIHDAIMYCTDERDLRQALETAYVHCRPGGAALFTPDHVRETFEPSCSHGGHDHGQRGLRYLQWDHEPDDSGYSVDYAFLLRDGAQVRCVYDRHRLGLFARADWLRLLADASFEARLVEWTCSALPERKLEAFVGVRSQCS